MTTETYGSQPSELPETLPAGTRWHYSSDNYGQFTLPARLGDDHYYYGDSDTDQGPQRGVMVGPERILWEAVPRHPAAPELKPTGLICYGCARPVLENAKGDAVCLYCESKPTPTVKKEPERAVAAKAPDPYVEHRLWEEREERDPQTYAASYVPCAHCAGPFCVNRQKCTCCGVTAKAIAAGAEPTELDRLAAARSRRSLVEQCKESLDTSTASRRAAMGQSAPCVLVRTTKRVAWTSPHPRGWPEGSGE